MAWPGVPCLLLLLLHTGLPKPGHPSPPSTPQCYIHDSTQMDVYCSWDPGPAPQIPTSYKMYWQSEDSTDSVEGTNVSGVIPRERYRSHSDLVVWVEAVNELGSVTSEKAAFNTGDIMKPPTPEILDHSSQPLEIYWKLECNELLGRSNTECEVRYRTEDQQDWTLEEENFLISFLLKTPNPYTLYEFQVRCGCECNGPETLMSDWSLTYKAMSDEAAPVKALDVWSDCGVTSELSQCALMWKELPVQFARGEVKEYSVTLLYRNGTEVENVVTVENVNRSGQLVNQEEIWRFNLSLQSLLGVAVSAYNSQGGSKPAHLALPTSYTGLHVSELSFAVNMTEWSLNASWFRTNQQIVQDIQEYVVQYNKAGRLLSKGFGWIKVDRNLMSVILRGQFENCTAYNVSLFAVFNNRSWLLASSIAYSVHGIPPKVPHFKSQTNGDSVTVSWQHNLLNESRGLILYYQLKLNSTVYNVSGNQRSYNFSKLPSGHHQVSIKAVTEAGLGDDVTINLDISMGTYDVTHILRSLMLLIVLLLLLVVLFIWLICKWKRFQVPDPMNSKLFQKKLSEFNSSWTGNCSSVENNPKISELEVVEIPLWDAKVSPRKMTSSDRLIGGTLTRSNEERDEEEHADPGGFRDKDLLQPEGKKENRREGYSKMIDTSEDEKDQTDSLSEDGQFISDYEKHYMPGNL